VHRLSRFSLGGVTVAACFAAALGALSSPGRAAEVLPSAQLLPADTLGYLTIHDVPRFKEAWGETQYGRLMADPAMQPFLEDIKVHFNEMLAGLEQEVGLSAAELYELPQGQVTLALTPSETSGIALVALMALGEDQANAERLLARGAEALEQQGGRRQEEDFQGTTLVIYEMPEPDPAADQPAVPAAPSKLCYFMKDQTLVLGSDVDVLKGIVARWAGDAGETFATNVSFTGIAERTASENRTPPLQWFMDPVGLFSRALEVGANPQAQMAAGMMPMLGLDKLKGIGGAWDLVTGPYDTVSRIQVAIEGPRQGLLSLLEFPSGNLQPEPWVPSDLASYFSMNWDVDTAWKAIGDLYNQFSGQGPGGFEQMLNGLAQDPNGPGVDVKADVIDPINGRVSMITDFQQPITATSQRVLFAFALDDAQTLSATVEKLVQLTGGAAQKREFQGHVIYDLTTPLAQEADAEGDEPAVQMAVAVAHDQLFFANNVTLLEAVLRDGEGVEPLAQSLDYRLVSSRIPQTASGISFSRPEQSWRSLYEMIRSGQFQDSMAGAAMVYPSLLNLTQAIDGEKLPEFDVVRRYLAPSGGYIQSDENGILLVNFALRKESP
jgi:hypothetical protein